MINIGPSYLFRKLNRKFRITFVKVLVKTLANFQKIMKLSLYISFFPKRKFKAKILLRVSRVRQ